MHIDCDRADHVRSPPTWHGMPSSTVQPENVLWDTRHQVAKLTDFGISTFFGNDHVGGDFIDSAGLRITHMLLSRSIGLERPCRALAVGGTFFMFAPEMTQSRNGAGYSAKAADIWAVGVSLYMWLYFHPPFEATSRPPRPYMLGSFSGIFVMSSRPSHM